MEHTYSVMNWYCESRNSRYFGKGGKIGAWRSKEPAGPECSSLMYGLILFLLSSYISLGVRERDYLMQVSGMIFEVYLLKWFILLFFNVEEKWRALTSSHASLFLTHWTLIILDFFTSFFVSPDLRTFGYVTLSPLAALPTFFSYPSIIVQMSLQGGLTYYTI